MTDIDFRGPFSRELDFNAYDFYPLLHDEMQRLGGPGPVHAQHLDVARSHSGNFIVPEQQSGFGSQPPFATLTPEPGEMRRMAYSSVSRGADGVMFFRWRPAHFGAEIYWMGVIDHDDIPRRRYDEARQFATEVTALKDRLLGTHVRMDVGIAGADFDNDEAHKTYAMGLPSPHDDALVLHGHCYRRGIPVGFIHPEDDLTPLKVLYVPHWLIWHEAWTTKLADWVSQGGTLILSARTGSRDANNHVIHDTAPGKSLSSLAGVTVEEFGRLAPPGGDGLFALGGMYDTSGKRAVKETESSRRQYCFRLGNREFTAAHMYEHLKLAEGTDAAGRWSNRWLEGEAAISRRGVGKGQVIYMGTYLTEEMMPAFEDQFLSPAGVAPLVENLPQGLEITVRQAEDRRLLFVLNTTAEAIDLPELPSGEALVDDRAGSSLPGYGVAILDLA